MFAVKKSKTGPEAPERPKFGLLPVNREQLLADLRLMQVLKKIETLDF